MTNPNTALVIIDAQRGFMPAEEGERLGVAGFGELPIQYGEDVVAPINRLLRAAQLFGIPTATTQDWHPAQTAHFADPGTAPNFLTNWPSHCVADTPGAELHPEIAVLPDTVRFTKGTEPLTRGEDDLSYSGYYATDPETGLSLPNWLKSKNVTRVILTGLALDYCLSKTGLDIRQQLGLEVTVASDATSPVAPATGATMLREFARNDIHTLETDRIISALHTA